ncbi:MAG: hypothetical protein ACRC5M_04555 [Anaeroplasmataceae bacterium]
MINEDVKKGLVSFGDTFRANENNEDVLVYSTEKLVNKMNIVEEKEYSYKPVSQRKIYGERG